MEQKKNRRFPPEITAFLLIAAHFGAFYGAKLLNAGRPHLELATQAEALVPFVPSFIYIYILAYVQWVLCWYVMYRREPQVFVQTAQGAVWASLLAFVTFLLLPTRMTRPDASGSGLSLWLVRLIYACDTPDTLFPSLHCLQSYLCWRGFLRMKTLPRSAVWLCFGFTVLVFASTVLVRQHLLPDLPAAVLAGELGLWISHRRAAERR